MAEYIDRDFAMQFIEEHMTNVAVASKINKVAKEIFLTAKDCTKDYLSAIPAADVAKVRHGEWIEFEDNILDTLYQCSVCKEEFVLIEGTPSENLWKYCPNCGAKMDGKENAE